jgi:hypothetical protein
MRSLDTGDGGRGPHVLQLPFACSMFFGPAREDAYTPVEVGSRQLLGDGRDGRAALARQEIADKEPASYDALFTTL